MQALKSFIRALARKGDYLLAHSSRIGVELENDLCRLSQEDPVLTIIDVGANHGMTASRYARDFPHAQIYCFEPVSSNFKILLNNCSRFSNIVPIQMGMSNKSGMALIGLTPHPYGHSLLLNSQSSQTEYISLTTLDLFMLENNIQKIDLLKIDVEGMELAVLNGSLGALRSSQIRYIYAECITIPDPIAPHTLCSELTSFLQAYNFVTFAYYHEAFHLSTGSALVNVLFVNRQFLPCKVSGSVHNIF